MLQDGGQVRLPLHRDVEPDDRRTGRGEQRRRRKRWRAIRRHSRRRVADRIHSGEQFRPGKREQYPVGLGIANLDSLDVDRERRRTRQHELIRDVKAPIGAAHGAWAREHRRREPGELWPGSIPATSSLGSAAVLACASAITPRASNTTAISIDDIASLFIAYLVFKRLCITRKEIKESGFTTKGDEGSSSRSPYFS